MITGHDVARVRGEEAVDCLIGGRPYVICVDKLPVRLAVVAQSLNTSEWHAYQRRQMHFSVNGKPADGRTMVRKGDKLALLATKTAAERFRATQTQRKMRKRREESWSPWLMQRCDCGCGGRVVAGTPFLDCPLWCPGDGSEFKLYAGHGSGGQLVGEFKTQKKLHDAIGKRLRAAGFREGRG